MVGGGGKGWRVLRGVRVSRLLLCVVAFFFSVISKKKKNLPRAAWELFPKSSVILTSTCGEIIGELGRI